MSNKINESLFPGDLYNLVKPFISIDKFVTKIDPEAIVVAFYVREEDPASDLSRYLEFGPVKKILATEVSPAPDSDGNYLVFVEINYTSKADLAKTIKEILQIVDYLTEIKTWKYVYKSQQGEINL